MQMEQAVKTLFLDKPKISTYNLTKIRETGGRMNKNITIKDVAKSLNISVSTVSRVMNGKDRVSGTTRKKVLEAIEKLDYVPNYAAVSIVKKQTKVIVVMLPDLGSRFYLDIVQGIEETAKSKGYFTMIFSSNGSSVEEADFINGIMGRFVDGIIAIPSSSDFSFFKNYGKPVVFVDRFNDDYSFDSVVVDNFNGARMATEHLIQNGHRNIALLSGPRDLNIGLERQRGYEQALRDHGIDIKQEYIRTTGCSEADGWQNTNQLLALPEPPTAVFAANENLCRGFYKALSEHHMWIVEDISLVCFNDNPLAQSMQPQITVIQRATNEMGKISATLLLNKIEQKDACVSPQRISLPVRLVVRGSVRNLYDSPIART